VAAGGSAGAVGGGAARVAMAVDECGGCALHAAPRAPVMTSCQPAGAPAAAFRGGGAPPLPHLHAGPRRAALGSDARLAPPTTTTPTRRAQYQDARSALPDHVRVVEMRHDGSWLRDSGPTVRRRQGVSRAACGAGQRGAQRGAAGCRRVSLLDVVLSVAVRIDSAVRCGHRSCSSPTRPPRSRRKGRDGDLPTPPPSACARRWCLVKQAPAPTTHHPVGVTADATAGTWPRRRLRVIESSRPAGVAESAPMRGAAHTLMEHAPCGDLVHSPARRTRSSPQVGAPCGARGADAVLAGALGSGRRCCTHRAAPEPGGARALRVLQPCHPLPRPPPSARVARLRPDAGGGIRQPIDLAAGCTA
jgi:hypothetical protein